jgi:large repetitive protein
MSAPVRATHLVRNIVPALLTVCALSLSVLPAGAVSWHSTAIDITPAEDEVWVCNPDHGTVGVISIAGNSLIDEIPVGAEPWCVDIHPTNGEAWVTSMGENRVYIVDVATHSVLTTLDVGFEPFGVAFDPQGVNALVTCTGSDQVLLIDVATRTITATLPVYRRPRGIAWRADGQRAWVTHLLMPEFLGRMTTVFPDTRTTSQIIVSQVFGQESGGYPSRMQSIMLAPPPHDDILWMPNNMINTTAGLVDGYPLTPTNIFHAVVTPINVTTSTDLVANTYFMSDSGTPVGGPIAVDFYSSRAFIANLHSNNVTVLNNDILNPTEVGVVPVGHGPIGLVSAPVLPRIYVANWLSRTVSVIANASLSVIATVPSTNGPDPLSASVLNGKQIFFSSNGVLAQDDVGSCASCHVFGSMDSRPWDLSQFGKQIRATPSALGIGFTGAHDWTADKDEYQDHEFGILEFTGGEGLTGGAIHPPLGAPNAGLNPDLDDLGHYMATLKPRTTTPFLAPGGGLTPDAQAGEAIFDDPQVGCATCHVPPFYTDSRVTQPFIKHDVGTADSSDADAAAGFDTPTLCGVWDTGPWLHHALAPTIQSVFTSFNPNDQHGTTSQLTSTELDQLAAFVLSIGWPDSTGTPVDAPVPFAHAAGGELGPAYPNPFADNTSLRFSLDAPAHEVRIELYDVGGRRVQTVLDAPMARGTHIAGWDSRDAAGNRVAPGTYFARLTVDGRRAGDKKMTVLR